MNVDLKYWKKICKMGKLQNWGYFLWLRKKEKERLELKKEEEN